MKTSTNNDFIREELAKDIDAIAADVVETLGKKGIVISSQSVYQVRNSMKSKKSNPRLCKTAHPPSIDSVKNKNSLNDHIINILKINHNGLSMHDLQDHLVKSGYQNNSRNFLYLLKHKLQNLVKEGVLAKSGLNYKFLVKEELGEYQLLRQAIIDFAVEKNIPNPESFPDTLIRLKRDFIVAKEKYSASFNIQ